MPNVVPVYYAPDLDTAWSANPGALSQLTNFAPLQSGVYGSVGTANYFGSTALTGSDILHGQMFRQVSGAVRLLVFRPGNIDEYDASATRTNRGTGYNAGTTAWTAAAWGNQIIACNYLDATQSSTGGAFTGLGGGAPKARFVAANGQGPSFVMLADVDDGGSNVFSDMTWWCAIENPTSWTPSLATEAGNYRLRNGAPGPIRSLVAYRDGYVAFKDNSIWIADYIRPPYVWRWRVVSDRIGCPAAKGVTQVDGKLYFPHTTGFWEFDGQNLRQVGLPIYQSFLAANKYINPNKFGVGITSLLVQGLAGVQAVADDIEGIAWFSANTDRFTSQANYSNTLYGYNARTDRWGIWSAASGVNSTYPAAVLASTVDAQSFLADTSGRVWSIWNDTSTTMRSIQYPIATTDSAPCGFTTGLFGSNDGSQTLKRIYHRTLQGTDDDSAITVSVAGYTSENKNKTNGTVAGVVNTEFDVADCFINSRFRSVQYTWSTGKKVILAGIGPDFGNAPR